MKLKIKKLTENTRNILYMACEVGSERTVIYLHGVSKTTGENQWYETKVDYAESTAKKYVGHGQHKLVVRHITKSTFTDWV